MHELECHLQSQACSVSDSLQEPWKASGWSRICSLPWGDSLQNLLLSKSTYSLLPKLGAVPVPCSWMVNCNCILKRLRRKKKSSKVWSSTSSAQICLLLDRQVTCLLEIHFALSQLMAPSSSAIRFLEENLQVLWVRNDCRHALPKANLGVAEHWAKAWLRAQHLMSECCCLNSGRCSETGLEFPFLLREHTGRDPLDKCWNCKLYTSHWWKARAGWL